MTCRCPMCGIKNAGKIHRGSYVRAGIGISPEGVGKFKRQMRKRRRVRETRQWKAEMA